MSTHPKSRSRQNQWFFPFLSSCCSSCLTSSHCQLHMRKEKLRAWRAMCNYQAMMKCATGRRFFLRFSRRKRSLMTPIWQTLITRTITKLTFLLPSASRYRTQEHLESCPVAPTRFEVAMLSKKTKKSRIQLVSFESRKKFLLLVRSALEWKAFAQATPRENESFVQSFKKYEKNICEIIFVLWN